MRESPGKAGCRAGPSWCFFVHVTPGKPKLPHDPVEGGSHTLRPADLIFLTSGIPIQFQRPPLMAVWEQASEGETNLDAVDPALCASHDTPTKDVHGKRDDDALMFGEDRHELNGSRAI